MDKDTRHALGNGSEDEAYGKNELPMPHPFEYGPKRPPLSAKAGTPNPAINERRPIARMHPDGGEASLDKGIPFGWRMGEPYDD
jgi:hypothetical protein